MVDEEQDWRRLRAEQCLKNAHGHIATAYAQFFPGMSPAHLNRAVRETLDAVDWIRRACESMAAARDAAVAQAKEETK
jgi:hypothetical protein